LYCLNEKESSMSSINKKGGSKKMPPATHPSSDGTQGGSRGGKIGIVLLGMGSQHKNVNGFESRPKKRSLMGK
jgi:hypothetical protein